MKKRIVFSILGISSLIFVSFTPTNNVATTEEITFPTVLTVLEMQNQAMPLLGKSFVGFKEAVAFKESQGNYKSVNKLGYLGKYQFGKNTLKRLKIYNAKAFLHFPALQEDAFIALCSINKWILRRDINRFVGKRIHGVVITESGILAAAHLSGAGNVKKYLRSYGAITFKDAFGTSIQSYLKKFAGYDTSSIVADRNPVF